MTMRWLPALMLVAGCGSPAPESQTEAPPAAVESAAGVAAGAGRVFFVQPQDGATVASPIMFEFGSEGLTVAPVPPAPPEGEALPAPRPGIGHYHLGVDTDCLPAGTEIPKADPWIHFGDGKAVIEMQMTPGPHRFSLQAGDDNHYTIGDLCQTISITVSE